MYTNWYFENVNFVKKWDFENVNCVKIGFHKCEFCEKWYFENVNFVKNETLKNVNFVKIEIFIMWFLDNMRIFVPVWILWKSTPLWFCRRKYPLAVFPLVILPSKMISDGFTWPSLCPALVGPKPLSNVAGSDDRCHSPLCLPYY